MPSPRGLPLLTSHYRHQPKSLTSPPLPSTTWPQFARGAITPSPRAPAWDDASSASRPSTARACQRADWPFHRPACLAQRTVYRQHTRLRSLTKGKGLEQANVKPFTRLDNGTWLHGRPERDVYRLLLDAYRLRASDDQIYKGESAAESIYAGKPGSLQDFQRFLDAVETAREGALFPSW